MGKTIDLLRKDASPFSGTLLQLLDLSGSKASFARSLNVHLKTTHPGSFCKVLDLNTWRKIYCLSLHLEGVSGVDFFTSKVTKEVFSHLRGEFKLSSICEMAGPGLMVTKDPAYSDSDFVRPEDFFRIVGEGIRSVESAFPGAKFEVLPKGSLRISTPFDFPRENFQNPDLLLLLRVLSIYSKKHVDAWVNGFDTTTYRFDTPFEII